MVIKGSVNQFAVAVTYEDIVSLSGWTIGYLDIIMTMPTLGLGLASPFWVGFFCIYLCTALAWQLLGHLWMGETWWA